MKLQTLPPLQATLEEAPFHTMQKLTRLVEHVTILARRKGLQRALEYELVSLNLESKRALRSRSLPLVESLLCEAQKLRQHISSLPDKSRIGPWQRHKGQQPPSPP